MIKTLRGILLTTLMLTLLSTALGQSKKVTDLTADTAPTLDDLLMTVNDPAGTPASRKATIQNVLNAATADLITSRFYCADAGANDTYTCSLSPAIASYSTGAMYLVKANTANTGAATINLNSIGATTIKKKSSSSVTVDLDDNDVPAGAIMLLAYDGTNMQLLSTLGNAGATVTDATISMSDITTNNSSTTQHGFLKKLSNVATEYMDGTGAWSVPAGGAPTFIYGPDQFKFNALISNTAGVSQIGISSTLGESGGGGVSNQQDADSYWRRQITDTSINTTAYTNWNTAELVRIGHLPRLFVRMKVGASSIGNARWFCGFSSADPYTGTDPTAHMLGFSYDTGRDGTVFWRTHSNDNSGGGTITATTQSIASSTIYNFAIVALSTSSVGFYVSTDGGVTYALVNTHTTNLPGNSGMDYFCGVRTLANSNPLTVQHSYAFIYKR